ncbi:hypothetical protein FACS1894171_1690 [Clostridia bacterium]|nr:hypothetical protein FACS1894171_1690 [Clostridia bacterium]
MLTACLFLPHPPIAVPGVGDRCSPSLTGGFDRAAAIAREIEPDIVVCLSPHGQSYPGHVSVHTARRWKYSFAGFGAPSVCLDLEIDRGFTSELLFELSSAGIKFAPNSGGDDPHDHGAAVPLYFLSPGITARYAVISPGGHEASELKAIGRAIRRVCDRVEGKALLLASGDQSHYLSEDGPYGFNQAGAEYDKRVVEIFQNDPRDFLKTDRASVNAAGQCAFEPWSIALEAIGDDEAAFEFIGYEAPYGVGYLMASAKLAAPAPKSAGGLDPYCTLARAAVFGAVCAREPSDYSQLAHLLPRSARSEIEGTRAGAFVSIHSGGDLRGCIGLIEPVHDHLGHAICYCAHQAALYDPRFPPITPEELSTLVINIDVLGQPEPVKNTDTLDVRRYGVIVSSGRKRGLLLPDLEGVDTPEQQIGIALGKAGIRPGEDYSLERFEVIRHLETIGPEGRIDDSQTRP